MQYIIGDIHGCFNTLKKLIEKVRFADENAKFVFVGDYVDRGRFNKESVEYIIELQKEGAICLRGNHDDIIDYLLNGHSQCDLKEMVVGPVTIEKVFNWWMLNGLRDTLVSYGVCMHPGVDGQMLSADAIVDSFRSQVPQEHKDFFRNLELFWENDTHFSCHAFMRPKEELPRSLRFLPNDRTEEMIWSRFPRRLKTFVPVETKWDKIGVFGHSPTNAIYSSPVPIKYDKIRLIDTGAFMDNYMCAYCCEQDDWLLQATDPQDIKE